MDKIKLVNIMLYHLYGFGLPKISAAYSVIRKTTWQISEPSHIIILIKHGSCLFEIDGQSFQVSRGDILFIPAKTPYTRKPIDDCLCEIAYVHFDLQSSEIRTVEINNFKSLSINKNEETDPKKNDFIISNKVSAISVSESDFFFKKFEYIISHFSTSVYYGNRTAVFELCSLLSALSKKNYDDILYLYSIKQKDSYPESLKKALEYIRIHSAEEITLNDLCSVAYISKQMLIKHFNKYLGMSPLKYIALYRANCIKPFLTLYPNKSIKEICEEFGFEDQSYFSRFFKKHTGESPTEYRNRVCNFSEKKHITENADRNSK